MGFANLVPQATISHNISYLINYFIINTESFNFIVYLYFWSHSKLKQLQPENFLPVLIISFTKSVFGILYHGLSVGLCLWL